MKAVTNDLAKIVRDGKILCDNSLSIFKSMSLRDMGIERLSIFHCFERVVGFHKIGKHGVTEQDV